VSAVHAPGAPSGAPGAVDVIVGKLRAGGGRITATRRVTIEVLLSGGEHRHLSAEDVAAEVRLRLPDVAESTIYRTLAALEELGVVAHVHLGHGPSTFHLTGQAHRHLVCRRCQAVIEVSPDEFSQLIGRLDAQYDFLVTDEHFGLPGVCGACRKRSTPPEG
jgi:Fur family ferric uptake transcriptional regulator